ncbi:MAG TPA: helix-turn-helix transcriptional regulator [Mesorhizobium sp.]|jgi:transcriptional regulator with XRE-family HTH domain|nr:helix-turn-helix transcriptional regulator [Mesorhizobium sp.]
MTLERYLSDRGIKPAHFATEVGVPASTITRLLRGERSPGLGLVAKIQAATAGAVTAADFMADPAQPSPQEAA